VSKLRISDHFDENAFPDPEGAGRERRDNVKKEPTSGVSKGEPVQAPVQDKPPKEPAKTESRQDRERFFDVDPYFLYQILSGKEDFRAFSKKSGYTERELQSYFIVSIRMINILFGLNVSDQYLTMRGIGEYREYWLKYIKEYEMMEKFDRMPFFDRFKEYFRTLNYTIQKDIIEQLKAVHEGRD
jgi:hypothetical protein